MHCTYLAMTGLYIYTCPASVMMQ